MSTCQVHRPVIAIVGGNRRDHTIDIAAEIRSFPSCRNSGNGSTRDAIAAIKSGKIQLVLVLARWIGHSEYASVINACKSARVRCMTIPRGSLNGYQREVQAFLDACQVLGE